LLSEDNCRAALADEAEEFRPEVAIVGGSATLACDAEWLAGARSCPNGSIICPARATQGVAPDADAGEEMALSISPKVIPRNLSDAALVHIAGRDVTRRD
jgi:hypothetical protein